jgi:hypothetical protein
VGHLRIRIRLLGPGTADHRHPESFMVIFGARIAALKAVAPNGEALGHALLEPAEAWEVPAVRGLRGLHEAALAAFGEPPGPKPRGSRHGRPPHRHRVRRAFTGPHGLAAALAHAPTLLAGIPVSECRWAWTPVTGALGGDGAARADEWAPA